MAAYFPLPGNDQFWNVLQMEATFSTDNLMEGLTLPILQEHPSTPPHHVLSLTNLPDFIKRRCPQLKRLKVDYSRHCSLWEFGLHLGSILSLEQLQEYEFTWCGGPGGILGFMGDFTSPSLKKEALRKLLQWSGIVGIPKQITLKGVYCVCQEDVHGECPNLTACAALKWFLEFCTRHRIPLSKV